MHRRCSVGRDGKTAYERNVGRRTVPSLAQIGERVWWMPLIVDYGQEGSVSTHRHLQFAHTSRTCRRLAQVLCCFFPTRPNPEAAALPQAGVPSGSQHPRPADWGRGGRSARDSLIPTVLAPG